MNRFLTVVAGMLFVASCYGSAAQTSPVTIGHGSFPAALTQTLDSSKLKEGDAVELETVGHSNCLMAGSCPRERSWRGTSLLPRLVLRVTPNRN